MDFHRRLRELRTARGMTQEALALACGWQGQSRIANYESTSASARQPKLDELSLLASALGVSMSELLGESSQTHQVQASHLLRPDPAILSRTHEMLTTAFAGQGLVFELEEDWDLFADAYEYLAEDDRPVDQRNLVDFGRWLAARKDHTGGADDQGKATAGQAGGSTRRRAG